MLLVLSLGSAFAVPDNEQQELPEGAIDIKTGNMDTECRGAFGDNAFGIAKWEYGENGYVLEDEADGYDTNVEGNAEVAEWTSVPDAYAVLHKEATYYLIHDGGASGRFENVAHGISHVTICGMSEEVPEMSLVLGGVALVAAVGLVAFRRTQ